jgi:hypothetical protein
LDIFFIYISIIIPFPDFLPEIPIPSIFFTPPPLLWGCSSTYPPIPASPPGIPLHWDIKPSQDQGPLLPLMPYKAILCYICIQNHGSFHVYSLIGGPVPWSSRGSGPLTLLLPPRGLQTSSAPSVPSLTHPSGPQAQSNDCLWKSASVFVRLWQSLSGDSYIRLLSASTSQHQQ